MKKNDFSCMDRANENYTLIDLINTCQMLRIVAFAKYHMKYRDPSKTIFYFMSSSYVNKNNIV